MFSPLSLDFCCFHASLCTMYVHKAFFAYALWLVQVRAPSSFIWHRRKDDIMYIVLFICNNIISFWPMLSDNTVLHVAISNSDLKLNLVQDRLANPRCPSKSHCIIHKAACSSFHFSFDGKLLPLSSTQTRSWRAQARNRQRCLSRSLFHLLFIISYPNLFAAELGPGTSNADGLIISTYTLVRMFGPL
jgi:hypothetical protein